MTFALRFLPPLVLCLLLTACVKEQVPLWSHPIPRQFFSAIPPETLPVARGGEWLASTKNIPVELAAYGSGSDIHVTLVLADPGVPATREELAKAAMAGAFTLYRVVQTSDYPDDRPATVEVYTEYGVTGESNVLLARATFLPQKAARSAYVYPGPAWKEIIAVERVPDKTELLYMRYMQHNRYKWGVEQDDELAMRARITPEQDAETSAAIGVAPGSVDLRPFILRAMPR